MKSKGSTKTGQSDIRPKTDQCYRILVQGRNSRGPIRSRYTERAIKAPLFRLIRVPWRVRGKQYYRLKSILI